MTDAEKADEICKKHIFDSNHFDCCMEMAEWKEKQMVSIAKTFIKEIARVCDITDENGYRVEEHYLLAELEKAMKGE